MAYIMPYTVMLSFEKFIENISIAGKYEHTANGRRDRIIEMFGDKFSIVEAFPTGSLVRGTGVKNHSDVDVIVALHYGKHIEGKTPARVLEDVREHLKNYRTKMAKKNGQAVTLYFDSWPNVDIVPAIRMENSGVLTGYQIPDMVRGIWIETFPQMHDRGMSRLLERDLTRIKMIKTWNTAHSECFSSFHLEVIALNTSIMTTTWPWAIVEYFIKALELIDRNLYHPNGSNGQVDGYLTYADRIVAKERLSRGKELATNAWYAAEHKKDDEEAIRNYRILFGDKFPAYG